MKHSIVIPAHNEAAVLEEYVAAFLAALPPAVRAVLLEVIIVENGSRDGTGAAAERVRARHPDLVRVLVSERPSYGEAIRRGMMESRGTHLTVLECDALDVNFANRSVELFGRDEARFIVASKRHLNSRDERPWLRRALTAWYNRILHLASGYPGSDTHGHKSIEANLAKKLCGLAVTTDESFQTEIVLIAWRLGESIVELPLTIAETRQPGVSLLRRLPMVLKSMGALRRSLARFPARPSDSPDEHRDAADRA